MPEMTRPMTPWKPASEDVVITVADGDMAAEVTTTAAGIPATATMAATTVTAALATTTRATTVRGRFISVVTAIQRCTVATGVATKQLERQASPAGRI